MSHLAFLSSPSAIRTIALAPSRKCGAPRLRCARRIAPVAVLHVPESDPLYLQGDSEVFSDAAHEATDGGVDLALDAGGGAGSGSGSGGAEGDSSEGDEDLPADVREAISTGLLDREAIARYRNFSQIPILGALMNWGAFRTRMLADGSFFFKLMIQELVGNGTALASEIVVRGEHIWDELEYVASDLIVGTVVEAAFVWLLAPTLSLPSRRVVSGIGAFLGKLPANAFEASSAMRTYTMPLRTAAFFYAAMQYFAIGVGAGVVGTAITYGLIEGRKRIDGNYEPKRPLPDVLPNSVAWGAFMALSSNTRFQIVEGLERAIAIACNTSSAPLVNAGIVTLRFANNYWGGVQFIQFFRFLGLHATEEVLTD